MKLYHAAASPFVRKVMVLLHETDQIGDVEVNTVATTPIAPAEGLPAANPLSKIPALERSDGPTLYDSRVICAYLDDRAGSGLYRSGAARWEMLTLEATADGIMDAAVSMTYEGRVRPEEKQWDGWRDAQWTKVAGAVGALNARWMSHLTASLNIGQIGVGCALGYLDLRHSDRDWRAANPALADWFADFESRPSMQATMPVP